MPETRLVDRNLKYLVNKLKHDKTMGATKKVIKQNRAEQMIGLRRSENQMLIYTEVE